MMTEVTTLAAQLDAISSKIPQVIADRIQAGVDAVQAPGVRVGELAPDFTLPNASGDAVALAELLGRGPVVLVFYRGEWCPFCNLQLRALQSRLAEITARGATIVAISPQTPGHGASLTDQHELGFDVLSDVDQSVIADYGLRVTVDGDTRELMAQVFERDLAVENANGSWTLPVPAVFVLDRDGVVRSAHVDADYRTRMEPADVVVALASIRDDTTSQAGAGP
jgi:peroxiredoxin